MEKQFVPYELAVKLKELGFNDECLARFDKNRELEVEQSNDPGRRRFIQAPLWQQAFDWFREYYGFTYIIDDYKINGVIGYDCQIRSLNDFVIGVRNKVIWNSFNYSTYNEARHACLEKLIELITKQK